MNPAFEAIYKYFHSELYQFILRRVSDPDTAEDIMQDVYIKIHPNIDDLRESDRLQSWIYQITRNAITDYYRRVRHLEELPEFLAAPVDDEPDMLSD